MTSVKSASATSKSRSSKYVKLDQREHVLLRPDMYVGSTDPQATYEFIAPTLESIEGKSILFAPALLRIFVEGMSNAIDNVERSAGTSTPCKLIKVSIDKKTGETSIWNDGAVIPIEIHPKEECYIHSMIFGHLLTGENYNDKEARHVSGRNGLGVKLLALFSSSFTVEGVDPENKKKFSQTWTDNMKTVSDPQITRSTLKKGYTKIMWTPDFKRLGVKGNKGYPDDVISLYRRYVIDAAMVTKVKVVFNDEKVPVKSLKDYALMYNINKSASGDTIDDISNTAVAEDDDATTTSSEGTSAKTKSKLIYIKNDKGPVTELVVVPRAEGGHDASGDEIHQAVSFVNGVYTRLGGRHVNACVDALLKPFADRMSTKDKKVYVCDVKKFYMFFVNARVDKPEFNSQEKEQLMAPQVKPPPIKASHITTVTQWGKPRLEALTKMRDMSALEKATKSKKTLSVSIPGYDPANNTNTKHSSQCSLIVCEGLSAKTLAVAGLDKKLFGKSGRSWFGILPLTGKLMNTRNVSASTISKNKVVTNIIKALKLKFGVDYTQDEHFKALGYGRLILMCDADDDGLHIEGLILNFIHSLYPSLMQRAEPYVVSMKTPIVRVLGENPRLFYDEIHFAAWMRAQSAQNKKIKMKYYKGLGTTRTEDVNDVYGKKIVKYCLDDASDHAMDIVFSKTHADERKKWLARFSVHTGADGRVSLDDMASEADMTITNFLNSEMIKFSHADCARSIPSVVDGLKESQRKILYCVKKRGLKHSGQSLKVAQLGGYTAEHSNYHHGEQNLYDTIVGMASDFVGSNNIPLLYRDGQFGTRLSGGQDAASARYIFTKMDVLTDKLFRDEDDELLTRVLDDGDLVQPETYVPIIPMVLVNGAKGIGTGWSSSVPCYNPLDVIKQVRAWILDKQTSEMTPWYRGFTGVIEPVGDMRGNNGEVPVTYKSFGAVTEGPRTAMTVKELPIGVWTDTFRERLDKLAEARKVKNVKNFSTPTQVNVQFTPDGKFDADKDLGLSTALHTTNMVLFDNDGKITKYDSTQSIVDAFCRVRQHYYEKRKVAGIKRLEIEYDHVKNKKKFVMAVIEGKIDLMNTSEKNIVKSLEKNKFSKNVYNPESGYDYLLGMSIRMFTKEKYEQLVNQTDKLKCELKKLKGVDPNDIWLSELGELEHAYKRVYK